MKEDLGKRKLFARFVPHSLTPGPTKLQVFANFLPPKSYNPLSPPYSPNFSPPDYFLFRKLKTKLKELHFADVAEIQVAVADVLKVVNKEEFSAAFQKLYDGAKCHICANVAYFE
jgi:hypothetical protein